ncbi:MAG: YerC/YecD family TrpR-related protein [Oscillospiraceae bacterium]|nr:YerC/YecD family TrpR-related protein [Eubacteriales bacterium]MDY2618003.1 YerC/YecD family TrpR-related protein [Oscillospiraceae bacterium]
MSKASDKVNSQELYRAILSLESEDECRRFFKDLCTIAELRAMEQRYDVAVLLDQGLVYSDILERTGASSATISRVNKALNYGEEGYKDVLRHMREQDS